MTDNPTPLPTQAAVPSQTDPIAPSAPAVKDEVVHKVETGEEEPYTIKCICNFSDDDGNTIYCETCDTWQHIDCFYPNNRDEAIREDFAHSCAECKPRPLDRQKAVDRAIRLRTVVVGENSIEKKTKRPQSRSHKKKPKLNELQMNGTQPVMENGKQGNLSDPPPPSKKSKPSHRPSQSVSSQAPKRSPSYGHQRSNTAHPLSPATTPPDLPDDFEIHHYSAGFYSLYNEHDVPDAHNNAFASLAIPTALSTWLREPETMKQEVGRTHADVFQDEPSNIEQKKPKLDVQDATRQYGPSTTLRWRFVKSTTAIDKDVPLIELNGAIGFQKDYCADPENLWSDLSSPLPFVFFHPDLPLYIDTRKEGSLARYVRRSCKPNAQLDTYLSGGSEYHFWLVSDRYISENEQITLPWDFRLEKRVCGRWLNLLGLSDDDAAEHDEAEMENSEYTAISNWIDRILSEYGGCACDLDNNCAFARFHRRYLYGKHQARSNAGRKKSRKPRTQAISPNSTGQATNSRAASEGHVDDKLDNDARYESASSRSKPTSRDPTPVRQGSLDQLGILTQPTDRDKRKVAMVEDSFRRMEQSLPPKKKKRTSDGTATSTSSSRPKGRNGSIIPHGHYVDSGTSRSKSGSPASAQSPHLSNPFKTTGSRQDSLARSRHASASPRPQYCDASVQTDPVEGEWFSEPVKSPRPRKRIISLSKRLLSNRQRSIADGSRRSQPPSLTTMITAMEIDSPPIDQKPVFSATAPQELLSPTSQGDVPMADAPSGTSPAPADAPDLKISNPKTPDLRVLMPPVPAFDNTGLSITGTTPQSASSSISQSPLAVSNPVNPFAPAVNGVVHPSPAKKKLSLSDYTKSRMNKAAGKVSGGSALLKSSLSSPEEMKVDITLDSHSMDKTEHDVHQPATAPATNGI